MHFYLLPTPPGHGQAYVQAPPSNYDWMIVKPYLQKNEGESIKTIAEQDFLYFRFVGKWTIEILGLLEASPSVLEGVVNLYASAFKEALGTPQERSLKLGISPLCTNKSDKMIAGKVSLPKKGSGSIYLLPPPTKCSVQEGIQQFLLRLPQGPHSLLLEEFSRPFYSFLNKIRRERGWLSTFSSIGFAG